MKYSCYVPETLETVEVEAPSKEEAERELEGKYGLLVVCEEAGEGG